MSIEEQLKEVILSRYKSVRAFTLAVGIPYSTLDSVFKRGIANAGVDTMLKVFNYLDLDIESILTGSLTYREGEKKASTSDSSEIEADAIKIYHAFVSSGLVKEGADLTPNQIDGLTAIVFMISALFPDDAT